MHNSDRARLELQRAIVIAGGGTGGHVFPGLALVEQFRRLQPPPALHWIGAIGGLEERAVPQADVSLTLLPMAGIARQGLLRGMRAGWMALKATARLWAAFRRARPALLIGVGGFASGPAVLAALLLGVPTLLLEQNAIPGRTNRMLSRFASAVAVSFAESAGRLRGNVVYTGNPVREKITEIRPRTAGPLRSVLSFGGSRGARAINEAWIAAHDEWLGLAREQNLRLTLQTGEADHDRVTSVFGQDSAVSVQRFIEDMPSALATADFVVARAGATTVAELTAAGRPSLLIPYPFAADDHQRANASALAAAGAALVIDPSEFTAERMIESLAQLAREPDQLQQMAVAARSLGRPDAAQRIATLAGELMEQTA